MLPRSEEVLFLQWTLSLWQIVLLDDKSEQIMAPIKSCCCVVRVEVDDGATRKDTSGTSDILSDISSNSQVIRKTSLCTTVIGGKMTCVSKVGATWYQVECSSLP